MLSTSITIGMIATTRLSTAAVVHVVQPRLEPPATTNESTFQAPPALLPQNDVTVSMARTALLVMGRRVGQRSSPVRRYLSQQKAMSESSDRFSPSPLKTNGWLGTKRSPATTDLVASAILSRVASASVGASFSLLPPPMMSSAVELATDSGLVMVSQCRQRVRSTSFVVSHDWEVISRRYVVQPLPGTVLMSLWE